ncbi:MAG: hypothetical protein ABWK53_07490 [Anaerolineales bacterium]
MRPNDTDLLFPDRLIPLLANLRSADWRALVQRVVAAEANPLEQAAFVLMMVRLNGCVSCNADSYRAMQGCLVCSQQTLKRFRGSDEDLLRAFEAACREVDSHLTQTQTLSSRPARMEMDKS